MTHSIRFCPSQLRALWLGSAVACMWLSGAGALAETSAGDAALFDRLDRDNDGRITADETAPANERLFQRLLRRGDSDGDKALTRDEFLAALVPSRPEKEIEAKQPATLPQADAVRWLLLSMDASGDSRIEAEEVPDDMRRVFDVMLERLDRNDNDVLERMELGRGGPPLAQIAGRFVQREGIDVAAELRKLDRSLGRAAKRFELQRVTLDRLADPKQAREIFGQLDGNANGQLDPEEVPESFRRPLQRLTRQADRDGDGRLSEREFLTGAKRMAQRQAGQAGRAAQARRARQARMEKMRERSSSAGESAAGDE